MGHIHRVDRGAYLIMVAEQMEPEREKPAFMPLRAVAWLAFLGPFFYLTYGTANWLASRQAQIGSIGFQWEHALPFLQWTIFPYWSINAFYALSLFVAADRREMDRLGLRLLVTQVVAVTFFVLMPLRATFLRPETSGIAGFMFDVLGGFDKPFNQAPSLHIALLIILWDHYRDKLDGSIRFAWNFWCVLIGISVLTTYQHHVMDIPTGALLGLLALWIVPSYPRSSPVSGLVLSRSRKARQLAGLYLSGSCLFLLSAILGLGYTPLSLILLWPFTAFWIVSAAYFFERPDLFQKNANGEVSLASRWLLAPYRLGAWLNVRFWTRDLAPSHHVMDNVSVGRFPLPRDLAGFSTVIDLTAEFARPQGNQPVWQAFPCLDLLPLPHQRLEEVGAAIESARAKGPVLVCCGFGFQRSGSAIAHWLLATGRVSNRSEAITVLESCGRPLILDGYHA